MAAVSAADGKQLAEQQLDAPPVNGRHGVRHRSAKAVAAGGGQSGKVAATTCHRAAGGGVGGAAVGGTGQRPAVHLALPALALHAVVDPPLAGPIPASAVLALSSGGDAAACRRRRHQCTVTLGATAAADDVLTCCLLAVAAGGPAGDPARQAATGVAALLPEALLSNNHRGGPSAAFTASRVPHTLRQELDGGWTVRFGPLRALDVGAALAAFVR